MLGEHTAHFLTTGEDLDLLHTVFAGKEHTSKEAADISDILDLGEYWVSQSTMVSSLSNSAVLSFGK